MSTEMKKELPWWQKYTLTLNEASEYFGIGYLASIVSLIFSKYFGSVFGLRSAPVGSGPMSTGHREPFGNDQMIFRRDHLPGITTGLHPGLAHVRFFRRLTAHRHTSQFIIFLR